MPDGEASGAGRDGATDRADGEATDDRVTNGGNARHADSAVPSDEVRAALARVLDGPAFARSPRNRTLLAHLVEETLAGRGGELNGTTVGQDALGKGDAFDPASDPSVRVQMGRLRRVLDVHYGGEGAGDPVRIALRRGSYTPAFERAARAVAAPDRAEPDTAPVPASAPEPEGQDPAAGSATPPARPSIAGALRGHPWRAAVTLLTVVAIAGGLVAVPLAWRDRVGDPRAYPIVLVRAFENRTGDPENDVLAAGLQRQFAADLQRFRTARVLLDAAPSEPRIPGPEGRADFAVTGSLLQADGAIDAIMWLIDVTDSDIAETERLSIDVDGAMGDYVDALGRFSAQLSAHVAGPRGRLSAIAARHFEEEHLLGRGGMEAFRCWSEFNAFVAARREADFAGVHGCLAGALADDPTDGMLLAALGWMELLGAPQANLLDPARIGIETSVARAEALVSRAISVAPGNDVAYVHHGLVNWFRGNEREALDSLRRAVSLNPADPQHMADYGLFLSYSGEWEKGLALVREAIAWDVDPPGWYRMPLYFRALLDGDPSAALNELLLGAARGDPFEPVYRIVAENMTGRQRAVEVLRPRVEALAAEHGGDALAPLRPWLRSQELLGLLARELREIGVPVADGRPRREAVPDRSPTGAL